MTRAAGACYIDPGTGERYPLDVPRWRSDRETPLMVSAQAGIARDEIDSTERSLWRYRAALPVVVDNPVSLGEGCTPLVRQEWGGGSPLFKLEWFSPTGSFKDRGSSVMLSVLRAQGVRRVIEDSSGNGGASISAYGAAGGLAVTVFAPASTSPAKLVQVRAHGAEIRLVEGPREASQRAAIDAAGGDGFYASHNWQAMFLEGTKTLAYELWEDLGFRAPDNVIVPVGAGSSLLGCALGFAELRRAGEIDRAPRLFAAQPLACSPLDAAFSSGPRSTAPLSDDEFESARLAAAERPVASTVAEGTAIRSPLRLREMVDALRSTGGGSVAIPEEGIIAAMRALAAQGLFVEPTSATAAAAFERLLADGTIAAGETTAVVLTGTGLKAPASYD